jgi:hypothetical protein
LTGSHFGFSSFSFVIDIILSKLFQKVSGLRHNIATKYTAVQNMDETIPDVGFSIGTIQRKKPVSKDTNPEVFSHPFNEDIVSKATK